MSRRGWVGLAIAGGAAALGVLVYFGVSHWRPRLFVLEGAVIRGDTDPRKEVPLADVEIEATNGNSSTKTRSDSSGYFRMTIPGLILPGQYIQLEFKLRGYETLTLPVMIRLRRSPPHLILAEMPPEPAEAETKMPAQRVLVSNIRVRYTVNSERAENIGSAARTFEVVNEANVPCEHRDPCSPDGHWKASTTSIRMDAGAGNEFRDARASCLAGPCPFTRIDDRGFARAGQIITASAMDWSGTATFLVQAEVFHTSIISEVRVLYPVVFDEEFNFTLPPTAEGTSLVAELGGEEIVFPLSPDLELSWASCGVRKGENGINDVFQCQLKPEFRFRVAAR